MYRHEPDIPERLHGLPLFCPDDTGPFLQLARQCVDRYVRTRHVRATGVRPIFHKHYQSPASQRLRRGMIYALRAIEGVPAIGDVAYRIPVPDFVRAGETPPMCLIKSVSSMGRVNLLAQANPEARFILIVRHPCGYVSSRLRQPGFENATGIGVGLPDSEQARRRGLTLQAIEAMPALERLAWVWAIFNEKAMEDGANLPNVHILKYEDLCASPAEHSRNLFEFLGLDWHPQCDDFLSESSSHDDASGYYSITRDSRQEIEKWRGQLSPDQIQKILDVVSDSQPGRLFDV